MNISSVFRQSKWSMKRKLFGYMMMLAALLIVALLSGMILFGQLDSEAKNIYEELIFYLFIEKRNYSEKQFCKSFIQESNIDYTYGQTKMTLLYKEKINKITGKSEIQYDKLFNK